MSLSSKHIRVRTNVQSRSSALRRVQTFRTTFMRCTTHTSHTATTKCTLGEHEFYMSRMYDDDDDRRVSMYIYVYALCVCL